MGQAARHSMAHCFREAPVTHEGGSIDGVQLHQDGPERADGRDLSEGAVERPCPLKTVKGVARRKLLFELAFRVGVIQAPQVVSGQGQGGWSASERDGTMAEGAGLGRVSSHWSSLLKPILWTVNPSTTFSPAA
jgi:hypothetical protein